MAHGSVLSWPCGGVATGGSSERKTPVHPEGMLISKARTQNSLCRESTLPESERPQPHPTPARVGVAISVVAEADRCWTGVGQKSDRQQPAHAHGHQPRQRRRCLQQVRENHCDLAGDQHHKPEHRCGARQHHRQLLASAIPRQWRRGKSASPVPGVARRGTRRTPHPAVTERRLRASRSAQQAWPTRLALSRSEMPVTAC